MSKPAANLIEFDDSQIKLLKETYAKDLNDKQFNVFLQMAQAQGLNPFTREIYGIVVGGNPVFIVGINGFRKIAHNSGKYMGCKVDVSFDNDSGKPFSAKAVVKKLVGDRVGEFEAEVFFKEFAKGNNWKSMPVQMIKKVAESHALRMAFTELQNVYEESEREAMNRDVTKSDESRASTAHFLNQPEAIVPEFIELEPEDKAEEVTDEGS